MKRTRSFIVNGYPDGELAHEQAARHSRRLAAIDRWRRMQSGKLSKTPIKGAARDEA